MDSRVKSNGSWRLQFTSVGIEGTETDTVSTVAITSLSKRPTSAYLSIRIHPLWLISTGQQVSPEKVYLYDHSREKTH